MRRFLFFIFCLSVIPASSQSMLKKGESYFSINGDSLRNVPLFNFHRAAWAALYSGKIPAYSVIPVEGEPALAIEETKKYMGYERISAFVGIDDWNYDAVLDPKEIYYIRTLTLNDQLWVSPMFAYGENQALPIIHFKMSDAEKVLDKSLCNYARQTFNGQKTSWTSSETREAAVYNLYAYSIASLMDSLYSHIINGKLKAYDYGSGKELDIVQVSNCLKESIYVMDPFTFEEFDSTIIVPFVSKFYGLQLHPQVEIDETGALKNLPLEFITVLTRSTNWSGYDNVPVPAYSLKVADWEQYLNETEKKIWAEFIAGEPSTLACIPSSSDNINFKDENRKKAFVEIFKKITADALAGKVSVLDAWEKVSLKVDDLKSIIVRKETLFEMDQLGNEIETQVEVALDLDSLVGIGIERYWRPTAKPGEFEVYKWLVAPQYPVWLPDGDVILKYLPYYIDMTAMVKIYGKETMAPLQAVFDESSKLESDLFEYVLEDDGHYHFKRLKNGESLSVLNCEPSVKEGDKYYFTYIYQDAGQDSETRTVYALRRSKVGEK